MCVKGEPVSTDSHITRTFRQNLEQGIEAPRVFSIKMVESQLDRTLLPYTLNSSIYPCPQMSLKNRNWLIPSLPDCSVLCNIQADFSTIKLSTIKRKTRHFWNPRQRYYQIDYSMRVVLGSVCVYTISSCWLC